MNVLHRVTTVASSLDDVFLFFSNAENLAVLTPSFLGFRILTPLPIQMEKGTLIDYELRILGMPTRWTTLITTYDAPYCFVDQQLKGPYSFWHHTHTFEAVEGGTKMTDTVRYVMPFGWLGAMVHPLVSWMLAHIFSYREAKMKAQFGS